MPVGNFPDFVQYLREKAGRLREAGRNCPPELSAKLRRLADEFEAYAVQLEAQRDGATH
jgi:hypothetical protein